MGKSTYTMGEDQASLHVRTMGEGGSNFCHFGALVLIE